MEQKNHRLHIRQIAEAIEPELVKLRRDFHCYAEEGWMEMRTSSLVARRLKELGYEVHVGEEICRPDARRGVPDKEALSRHADWAREHGADLEYLQAMKKGQTGVVGILRLGEGPTLALRFDLDALPVEETRETSHLPEAEGFACRYEKHMHACGHDGHTAIGLGTAKVLAERKDQLQGEIRLIFQPAEEGVRGARAMTDAGVLEGVDYLLGGHVMASEDGSCYLTPGLCGTLATTKLDVCFRGRAAHAAKNPELGQNALLAACSAVLNLHAISRHSGGSSRINVGTLHAGPGRNVICDQALLELEVRGETTEINTYMEARARAILQGAAAMQDCEVVIDTRGSAPVLQNSEDFTEQIRQICKEELELPVRGPKELGASEDFAYMTNYCISKGGKACFVGLHTRTTAPLHNERFDFDEKVLVLGTCFLAGMAAVLLEKK